VGFSTNTSLKSKLAASVAILATILGGFLVAAPAHATGFTPNAGSNSVEWTSGTQIKTFDGSISGASGSQTFQLSASSRVTSLQLLLRINNADTNVNQYFADGAQHYYYPNLTLTDANNNSFAVTPTFSVAGAFGATQGIQVPTAVSSVVNGNTRFAETLAADTGSTGFGANFFVGIGTVTLPAGTYTLAYNILRDGLPIASSNFMAGATTSSFRYVTTVSNASSLTFSGLGTQSANALTCVNSSLVAAGDTLTLHPLLDGADWTTVNPVISWKEWGVYSSVSTTTTRVVTSADISAGLLVSYSNSTGIAGSDTGTHSAAVSITNQNGTEVTTSCAPAGTATVTSTPGGPYGNVTTSVSNIPAGVGSVALHYIDNATSTVVDLQASVFVSNGTSTYTHSSSAAGTAFTPGHTYTVEYEYSRPITSYFNTVPTWFTGTTFTYPSVSAPTVTNSGTTYTVTIPGVTNTGYAILAYDSANPSVVANVANTSAGVGTFTVGTTLNYATTYTFKWCAGLVSQTGSNQFSANCTSGYSPASASITTGAMATPTVTVSGTSITVSVSGTTSGAIAFYTPDANGSLVSTKYLSSLSNTTLSSAGLNYGTTYVAKWCPTYTSSGSVLTCTGTLSAASNPPFSVATPAFGYTIPTVSAGTAEGNAHSGLTATTYNAGSFVKGSDGSNGFLLAQVGSGVVTIKHFTAAGQDASFGSAGVVTVTAPGVTMVNGLTYSGNRDKWLLSYSDSMMVPYVATGTFTGATTATYSLASSPVAQAAYCNQTGGYGASTMGNINVQSLIPNPMGDIYLLINCSTPVTYSDATTGSTNASALLKVTGNNAVTIVTKFNAATAAENYVVSLSGSMTPGFSVNYGATGSAVAVVFPLAVGSISTSGTPAGNFSQRFVELKADGSVVTVNGSSIASSSGILSQMMSSSEVNNGTSLLGMQMVPGVTPVYTLKTIDLAAGTASSLTIVADSVSALANGIYTLPAYQLQSTNSSYIWVYRYYGGTSPYLVAPAKLNLSTGGLTTYETVSLAYSSSSSSYNWNINTLDSSGIPTALFGNTTTKYASVYWRTTSASSGSSNVATATFTMNGSAASDGQSYSVPNATTSVPVVVTPTESHATYTVSGNTNLTVGSNTVTIVVTAQDGTTTHTYTFTVVRSAPAPSAVATATFTVDGNAVTNGGTVYVAHGVTTVAVVVTRAESHASVSAITGATGLVDGSNSVTFSVTAQDTTTTQNYGFTVVVAPSDAVLCPAGTFSINGGFSSVANNWTCTDAPAGSFVAAAGAVAATQCDAGYFSAGPHATACTPASVNHYVAAPGASAEVACAAGYHATNTASITCAADYVAPPAPVLSSDATASVTANGAAIAGGVINLVAGTKSVAVSVTPTESHATYTVTGSTSLVAGNNTVTVTVTAQNGNTRTYSFTAVVAALPADATAAIAVAGSAVVDGGQVNLPFGTKQVAVSVTPTDAKATYTVSGATGLTTGTNALTVTVTAQNGTKKSYSVQLVVAADTTPVAVATTSVTSGGSTTTSTTVLNRVQTVVGAGRVALVTFKAKGVTSQSAVVTQIRAFKTAARAAGVTGRISFTVTNNNTAATGVVKITK